MWQKITTKGMFTNLSTPSEHKTTPTCLMYQFEYPVSPCFGFGFSSHIQNEKPKLTSFSCKHTDDIKCTGHRRRKRGGGQPPSQLFERGGNIPFAPPPPIIHPHFFLQFLCETGKNHNCTKLKGKIMINVTLI